MPIIKTQTGRLIDIEKVEIQDQRLANTYIEPGDCVLELGGRYGSVSCLTNSKLLVKTNHVVVEPDQRVWDALQLNRDANECFFHIVKGFLSRIPLKLINLDKADGYATSSEPCSTSSAPCYTVEHIQELYGIQRFTALIADCEGCLERFLQENPTFLDGLRLILFEADYPQTCNYEAIRNTLKEKGFTNLQSGFHNAWTKPLPV